MREIPAIAIFEALPGKEDEARQTLRALLQLLAAKGYSRDLLFHDPVKNRYFALRYWASEEARARAHEDPEVHTFWAKLGHEINMLEVYERLEQVGTKFTTEDTEGTDGKTRA